MLLSINKVYHCEKYFSIKERISSVCGGGVNVQCTRSRELKFKEKREFLQWDRLQRTVCPPPPNYLKTTVESMAPRHCTMLLVISASTFSSR